MAIFTPGGAVGQISGSIGSVTYSHNKGGAYARAKAIPTNPNTALQQVIRGLVSQLTSLWGSTLTQAQRDAWETYSDNVLLPNALGEQRAVGGLPMYVRSNVHRLQASLPRVDAAPTTFNLGDYTQPTITSITAPTALSLAFTVADDWVGEDDAALNVYGSAGYNQSINFFKGPYQFAGQVLGDSVTPPTSPAAIVMPKTLTAGQRAFIFGRVSRPDGRLSSPFRLPGTVV